MAAKKKTNKELNEEIDALIVKQRVLENLVKKLVSRVRLKIQKKKKDSGKENQWDGVKAWWSWYNGRKNTNTWVESQKHGTFGEQTEWTFPESW